MRFFFKFGGWFCQGHPDARWASTWVRSRLKGIAAAPRSSIVIYVITWGWSHSLKNGPAFPLTSGPGTTTQQLPSCRSLDRGRSRPSRHHQGRSGRQSRSSDRRGRRSTLECAQIKAHSAGGGAALRYGSAPHSPACAPGPITRPPRPSCIWPVQRGARPTLSLCKLCPLRKFPRSQSNPIP
jgi:hypothetical protein